jgi:carbonic anhydrase
MDRIIPVNKIEDIPAVYRDTPIQLLMEYHNLNRHLDVYQQAQVLVGMCMDSRKHLRIPENFAYILRTGGANLRYSEFKVSFAVGIGGVTAIALIGHNECRMANVTTRKVEFVEGLVKNAGWDRTAAEEHFSNFAAHYEIGDEIRFILSEVKRLRECYPKILVAPMFYNVDDNRISFLRE